MERGDRGMDLVNAGCSRKGDSTFVEASPTR
jgi:hypothetical protein